MTSLFLLSFLITHGQDLGNAAHSRNARPETATSWTLIPWRGADRFGLQFKILTARKIFLTLFLCLVNSFFVFKLEKWSSYFTNKTACFIFAAVRLEVGVWSLKLDIAARIKQIRGKLSQDEFSELVGVHKNSIGRYERGDSTPDMAFAQSICTKFGVCPDWLIFGRGPMRPGETAPTAPHSTLMPHPVLETPLPAQENARGVCTEMKRELELERHELIVQARQMITEMRQTTAEIRELTTEIRTLTSENRQLWKENGELREKCARLEERQYQRSVNHDGGDAVDSA